MNLSMQHLKSFVLTTVFLLCSLSARASSDDTKAALLAKQNACLGCHALDKKIVGPSFQAVAKKYANDPSASAFLKTKLLKVARDLGALFQCQQMQS